MEKIVVTGAGGFIGFHVCKALSGKNLPVIGLYKKNMGLNDCLWDVIESDLLSDSSDNELGAIKPSTIIHCASVLPGQFNSQDDYRSAELNRSIDDRIIKFCSLNNCRLIYASGTSIYGLGKGPWSERSAVDPVGPYISAKLDTEKRINRLVPDHVILRLSAPYGPGQKARTVLRIFIENAMANLDLKYNGSGKRQQDFTAAEDIASAFLSAVQHSHIKGLYNIASGFQISMKDLAVLVVDSIPGCTSKVCASGIPDPQEEYRAIFDISKARDVLGWIPKISLRDGIINWFRSLMQK